MFNITILQSTLMAVLNYLEPTVGKNTTNMGDDCIYMESLATGSCKFFTTNMIEFAYIEAICSNSASNDVSPYVSFKRLKGIISTIPSTEYITMLDSGKNELLISFAMKKVPIKLVGNLNGMPPIPLAFNSFNNTTYEVSTTFLKSSAQKASNIIQDSATNILENCIKYTINQATIFAEAMDINTKRTFFMMGPSVSATNGKSFFIEASKLNKALKMFEDYNEVEIGSDNNMTLIQSIQGTSKVITGKQYTTDIVDTKYAIRQLTGLFPNIAQYYSNQYIPTEYITVNKTDLLNSINRVHALVDTNNSASPVISIKADKSEFNLKYSSIYGEVNDMVDTDNNISIPFNTDFNYKNLESIIKNIHSDFIDIGKMKNTQNNFIVKGSTTGNNKYTDGDMYTILASNGQQTP